MSTPSQPLCTLPEGNVGGELEPQFLDTPDGEDSTGDPGDVTATTAERDAAEARISEAIELLAQPIVTEHRVRVCEKFRVSMARHQRDRSIECQTIARDLIDAGVDWDDTDDLTGWVRALVRERDTARAALSGGRHGEVGALALELAAVREHNAHLQAQVDQPNLATLRGRLNLIRAAADDVDGLSDGACRSAVLNFAAGGLERVDGACKAWAQRFLARMGRIDPPDPDPEDRGDHWQTFQDFWADLVLDETGHLVPELVARELHDFRRLMARVAEVYDHVTAGGISSVSARADAVIAEADRVADQRVDEAVAEAEAFAAEDLGHVAGGLVARAMRAYDNTGKAERLLNRARQDILAAGDRGCQMGDLLDAVGLRIVDELGHELHIPHDDTALLAGVTMGLGRRAASMATEQEAETVAPITITEACRDDGGPLTCRECGKPIDRSAGDYHFVESPFADCGACYRRATADDEE